MNMTTTPNDNAFISRNIIDKKPLVIIAGPTAVGKSSVSVELAKLIGGEVVSADSVQVYKGLDIGSAKATTEEMDGVPHHLIDVIDPSVPYDAAIFQKMAMEAIDGIYQRGHVPILCGGTGFYIQALLYGIDFTEEDDDEALRIRKSYEELSKTSGGQEQLVEKLRMVDPEAFNTIHEHNIKRVIRALCFYDIHGTKISVHNETERGKEPIFDAMFFVLNDDRAALYERINKRVDQMVDMGLVHENEMLRELGLPHSLSSMSAIGYKEIQSYLDDEISLEDAIELIKKNSRNYAKRQVTWFKREPKAQWIDIKKFNYEKDEIAQWILNQCTAHWE